MNPRTVLLVLAVAAIWLFSPARVQTASGAPPIPNQDSTLYLPLVSTPPEPAPAKLGADFGNLIMQEGVIEQDFPLAKQMGAQWNRIELPWMHIEAEQGVYTWEKYDAIMAQAAALGFDILMLIHSSPSWAAEEGCGPISDTAAFEKFLAAAIDRYGDDVDAWEFMNEPDGHAPRRAYGPTIGCWAPHPDKYAEQLGLFYTEVKELDPTAQVVFGSLAYDSWGYFDREFLSNALDHGAGHYFDVLGIHYYPFNLEEFPTADIKVREVQATLNAHQVWNKKIWITETAMWSNGVDGPEGQHRYVIREQTRAFCSGADNLFWFGIRQEYPADILPLHRWLISIDHRADQAYATYQRYAAQVTGMTCRGAVRDMPAGVEAYYFTGPGGAQMIVMWSTGTGTVNVHLPAQSGATVTSRDGQVDHVQAQDGSVTVGATYKGVYVTIDPPGS